MRHVPVRRRFQPQNFLFFALTASLLLTGCQRNKNAAAPAASAGGLPVGVLTVQAESVTLTQELPGRLSAYRIAEVRARISGIVHKRLFEEGSDVKVGDVLFEIDPAPYEAALDSARAALARAEARVAATSAQADRFKALVASNAISKQNYDDAVAAHRAALADVEAARAAVRTAEINLGYTRVTSPITGRIGRAEVTEGAYVQQGAATLLAVVQQLDPLYVDLSQSAEQVLDLKEALAEGRLQRTGADAARFTLILHNGAPYRHPGSLQFSDVSVNEATSSVTLRGTVPNPDLTLLPGMFIRARLEEGTSPNAILLPQSVVSRNARGEPVTLLVGADNKVEVRPLQIGRAVGNRWLVTSGVAPGDRVIVDNLQKIRPGMPVSPIAPATSSTEPDTAPAR